MCVPVGDVRNPEPPPGVGDEPALHQISWQARGWVESGREGPLGPSEPGPIGSRTGPNVPVKSAMANCWKAVGENCSYG